MESLGALISSISLDQLWPQLLGFIGGGLFFGSWVLQAWESRRHGSPIVSVRFFLMRSLASALLAYEGARTGSLSIFLVMLATMILMLYNVWLHSRKAG